VTFSCSVAFRLSDNLRFRESSSSEDKHAGFESRDISTASEVQQRVSPVPEADSDSSVSVVLLPSSTPLDSYGFVGRCSFDGCWLSMELMSVSSELHDVSPPGPSLSGGPVDSSGM
jgi:hypothetical protein